MRPGHILEYASGIHYNAAWPHRQVGQDRPSFETFSIGARP